MKTLKYFVALLVTAALAVPVVADVTVDGFLQGLYGGRLDKANPTATEMTASETRMQLRAEHFGDNGEFFGRLDFVYDGADSVKYDWELREGYFKFRVGDNLDFKIGRQILTWGTGDLVFINDVFAKDYRSFFVGRDDQYLKAPQSALRIEYYNPVGALSLVYTPRFEANRLPTGRKLSYYNPMADSGRGEIVGEDYFFDPTLPEAKFKNGELAARFNRYVAGFNTALYFYHGFYKNPQGAVMVGGMPMPVYPRLNVYGASMRGSLAGGIVWMEGGYFDSRDDRDGDDPMMPNSSVSGLLGFERQVATNLTANIQWKADYMLDHNIYEMQQQAIGGYVHDELRHLLTSRITKLLNSELLTLSGFMFYSPSDEDLYARLSASYKYTDEVTLTLGGNFFDGNNESTKFGQFQLNDNIYAKMTYGF